MLVGKRGLEPATESRSISPNSPYNVRTFSVQSSTHLDTPECFDEITYTIQMFTYTDTYSPCRHEVPPLNRDITPLGATQEVTIISVSHAKRVQFSRA